MACCFWRAMRIVVVMAWGGQGRKDAKREVLPVSCRKAELAALTGAAGPAALAHQTQGGGEGRATGWAPLRPCTHLAVSLFLVLSLWIPGSGQIAVAKPGELCVFCTTSAGPLAWAPSLLAMLVLWPCLQLQRGRCGPKFQTDQIKRL